MGLLDSLTPKSKGILPFSINYLFYYLRKVQESENVDW